MTQAWNDEIWRQAGRADNRPSSKLTALAGELTKTKPAKVLDLGCGAGAHFEFLAGFGAQVTGADQSSVALERAASRGLAQELVQVTDESRVPLADNLFDLVWCVDTIEHVLDTQILISEARRVLKPRGALLVATPGHSLPTRMRLALTGWDNHFDPMSPHLRFFTRRSLASLIEGAGFGPARIETAAGQLIAVARRP